MTLFALWLAAAAALRSLPAPACGEGARAGGRARSRPTRQPRSSGCSQWIALPTIANMGINHAEGADYMRRLALDAGLPAGARSSRPRACRRCSRRSTPARRSRSASISCTTSSITTRPNGPRRRSRRGWSTGRARARRSSAAARSTRRGRKPPSSPRSSAFKTAGRQAAGQPRAGRRGRGGDRLAQLPAGARRSRGAGGAEQGGRASSSPCAEPEQHRRGLDLSLGAKGVIEVQLISSGEKWGRGPEQGRPFEPDGQRRQPGLAAGQGAQHAGRRGRLHPRDRRLVRECEAADRAPEADHRRGGRGRQRGRRQEGRWASRSGPRTRII